MVNSQPSQEKERTYTYPELRRTFFPNVLLSELEEDLAYDHNLPYPWQHELTPDEEDPRCGSVEIAKRNVFDTKDRLQRWLSGFYKLNGYESQEQADTAGLLVTNSKKESFRVSVLETETSFRIQVAGLQAPQT